jgi:pimeloyl-ACP methyl ester carboxylesterase
MWPELVRNYRVLTLDMLGFGFSDKPYRHDYRIVEQADIYKDLLQPRGVTDYHLFAHDYGVSVGQELMARGMEGKDPERRTAERRLVSRDSSQNIVSISPAVSDQTVDFTSHNSKSLAKSMRQVFGPKVPPTETFLDGILELPCYNHRNRVLHKLIHYTPDRIEHGERWVSALQRQGIPVRLTDGAADPISGCHMAKHYRELIPNADVVELEDIGRYPQVQAPKAVLNAYLESLSGHIPRSSLRSSDLLPFYHQYPAACCGDFLFPGA